jgi:hypothetical protein
MTGQALAHVAPPSLPAERDRQDLRLLGERMAAGYRIAPNTPLPPLPVVRQAIAEAETALAPCEREVAVRWVRYLINAYRANDRAFRDESHAAVFQRFLAHHGAGYPADILEAGVHDLVRTSKWLPVTAELVAACERLVEPRRAELRAARAMQAEHERRQTERETETGFRALTAEQQAEHEARMQALYAALRGQAA